MVTREQPDLVMRFVGRDADKHPIGMRNLSEALVGMEGIITAGLYILETGIHPKIAEQPPLLVRAFQLRAGSVEISAWLAPAIAGFLPIFHEFNISSTSI